MTTSPTHRNSSPSDEGQPKRRVQPVPRRGQTPPPSEVQNSPAQPGGHEVQRNELDRASKTIPTSDALFPAPAPKRTLLGDDHGFAPTPDDAGAKPGLATIQSRQRTEQKTSRRRVSRWVGIAVAALFFGLALRVIAIEAIYTDSPVMDPTLSTGDRFYMIKLSYAFSSAERGDIVLIERDATSLASDSEGAGYLIRRVIATEGDVVQAANNQIVINEAALAEPYLEGGTFIPDFASVTVPEGSVLVLSDSRRELLGRDTGPQPTSNEQIVGKAVFVYWPRSSFGLR